MANAQTEDSRLLLSQLLDESKIYKKGEHFLELLDFVNKLPNFAPFNAFLLHIQKPGLQFAASQRDWQERFNRTIKEGARPLLILWPFAPIALVYDVDDTEGDTLPIDVGSTFRATGAITNQRIDELIKKLQRVGIDTRLFDYGSGHAGHIQRPEHDREIKLQSIDKKQKPNYLIRINKAHEPNVQFATLIHELAHLYLGHLGQDVYLKIVKRDVPIRHEALEIEAESVCYIVCRRNGVEPNSSTYLSSLIEDELQVDDMDLHILLKAAGQIEVVLDLVTHTRFSE